ncbi:MAG: dCTP deaminase [Desulfobacteraceae bacterium]|nr:dCTP deaminase [Desulfobacteraceae bacterium]
MSTLTRDRILERFSSELPHRLVVTPILSKKQLGEASIDVRLSNQFIVFRMHTFGVFQPFNSAHAKLKVMQERQIVKFGKEFVLHPGILALGCTFEYICLPSDVECQVEGRSSWARLGLQIATATSVEPGFKGVLTLELSNLGTIPIELYPGVRIAQLFFHDAKPEITDAYGGTRKYRCPVGPQFSLIANDKDGKVFSRQANTND